MKHKLAYTTAIFLCLGFLVGGITGHAHAVGKQAATGLTVTPAQLSFIVQANDPSKTAEITLANSYNSPLRMTAELQGIDEQAARLVPSGSVDEQIDNAVKLSATDITVPAKGTYKLQVSLNGTWLSDGGHYATLVLTERSDIGASSGFQSAVAVNLFIIRNEHIRTDLQLTAVTFDNPLLSLPKSASIVLKNKGNTHIIPRASIIVYDGDDAVSKAVVNSNSALLLPGDEQRFTVKLDTLKRFWLPRKLTAHIMYRIDGSDVQLMKTMTLWHVPFVDIVALAALVYAIWHWRRYLVAASRVLRKVLKKYLGNMTKRKNPRRTPTAPTKEAKISYEHVTPMIKDQTQALDETWSPPQEATVPRHITVRMSELAKPLPLAPTTKRIAITVAEESVKQTKTASRKRSTIAKKQPVKKAKTPKKSKTTHIPKKPSTKNAKNTKA